MFPFSFILDCSGPQKRQFVTHHFGYEPNRCRHFWTPSIALLGAPWHALYSHHVYLIWRVLVIGSEMTVIWVKKKKFRLRRAPSSGISLSGGQVSDGRLCRGLIVAAEHPHDMFYTHITSIWSETDSVLGQRWWKSSVFWYLLSGTPQKVDCMLSLRGRTQSLPSLLNTVTCPYRCAMTCLTLTPCASGLERTQHWIRDDEKVGYLGLKNFFFACGGHPHRESP